MPVNAGIYGQIQPQQQINPLAILAQVQQMKALQAEAEDRQFTRDAKQRDLADDNNLRKLFQSGQTPTTEQLIATGGAKGIGIAKALTEQQKSALDARKAQLEEVKAHLGIIGSVAGSLMTMDMDHAPQAYAQMRTDLIGRGVIRPEDAPEQFPGMEWLRAQQYQAMDAHQQVSAEQKAIDDALNQQREERIAADQKADNERMAQAAAETGRHNRATEGQSAASLAEQRRHNNETEKRQTTGKPSTGQEKHALNFFNRAQQADKDLEKLEDKIQNMSLAAQGYMDVAPNFAQTQTSQQYTAAQRAFTEARLRKDSGAAIPNSEFDNDRKTYFRQTGDSPETLEQKRRARATLLASMGFESGRALGEYVGDEDEAAKVIGGYKARAAGTAPAPTKAAPAAGPKIGELRTVNGQRARWDGKGWLPVGK